MNIAVCIKQVPGTTNVEVDSVTGVLKRDGIDSKMNPYDLYALESAIRIKEENNATINAITMGPPQAKEILKEAYMMGADEAILISDRKFAGADVLATAYTLAQGIKKINEVDLIICGKMTTDGDTAQVGPEMAEFLDIPHIANVTRIIEINEKDMIVEMDMSDTLEIARIKYPCLITVEKGIFQPRLPSFKLKIETKDKIIKEYGLKDFSDQDENNYGLNGSPTQVKRIFPPESNNKNEVFDGDDDSLAEQLYDKLVELKFL